MNTAKYEDYYVVCKASTDAGVAALIERRSPSNIEWVRSAIEKERNSVALWLGLTGDQAKLNEALNVQIRAYEQLLETLGHPIIAPRPATVLHLVKPGE